MSVLCSLLVSNAPKWWKILLKKRMLGLSCACTGFAYSCLYNMFFICTHCLCTEGSRTEQLKKDSECDVWKGRQCPVPIFRFRTKRVYISHKRKQRETIKPSLLGNGSCVLHRCLTPRHHPPPSLVPLLWKHDIRGSAFASLSGLSHRGNLWIQANQKLPGGLKVRSHAANHVEWSGNSKLVWGNFWFLCD